ncbi:MAG: type I-B CRISPR-associated protein Cas7/Csh2 [Haliscomenobacter sp.]|nr:type I-B CRISPR-associated protein Cas7/Csh2 [Haliscomenobacter sp.]
MIIEHNADFLLVYEAIQCNPNGDPDQENKPRMDYETLTNLVTDVRVKRYVRDFFKESGKDIFVDMEGDTKVSMDERLRSVLMKLWSDDEAARRIIQEEPLFERYLALKGNSPEEMAKKMINKKDADKELNRAILSGLVRERFIDVRLFGSAFAVEGFNKAMTGPIQMNWGYSLNKAFLLDSDTISSIMNDDSSTFGKDYRIKYSLLAFHGSINKAAAKTTGMTENDLRDFRHALWNGISANPTRSKLNQYPKLYVELVYNPGYYNGHFGDLRTYLSAKPKSAGKDKEVRGYSDLRVDYLDLETLLKTQVGEGKPVKEVIIKTSPDVAKDMDYGNA